MSFETIATALSLLMLFAIGVVDHRRMKRKVDALELSVIELRDRVRVMEFLDELV